MDETILIQKSQQGDMDAFEQLLLRYEKKVYTIAYKYMGNAEDASDLAQEALIRAYQSIGTFRGESSFGTWIGRITANKCLDELRKRKSCRPHHWMRNWSWRKAVYRRKSHRRPIHRNSIQSGRKRYTMYSRS